MKERVDIPYFKKRVLKMVKIEQIRILKMALELNREFYRYQNKRMTLIMN